MSDYQRLLAQAESTGKEMDSVAHFITGYALATFQIGPQRGLGEDFAPIAARYEAAKAANQKALQALLDHLNMRTT